jgi:hypothetical protein
MRTHITIAAAFLLTFLSVPALLPAEGARERSHAVLIVPSEKTNSKVDFAANLISQALTSILFH